MTAKDGRDEGMGRVLENERSAYRDAVYAVIQRLPPGRITGEDIRLRCERELGLAHHQNFWGAAIHVAITREWLIDTGETTHMRATSSHARKNPIYVTAVTSLLE